MKPVEPLVLFEFGRHRIEALDFGPFLARYAPGKLPDNPRRLRAMMGSLMPCVHGYDQDRRELHCIPEVRRFVREFHTIWPHWLFFFCALPGASTLEVFSACCLDHFNVIQRDGAAITLLDPDPAELTQFLMGDLPAFRAMCDRAEVFPELRRARLAEVFGLFGLRVPRAAQGFL
jgi:hypothetical protein